MCKIVDPRSDNSISAGTGVRTDWQNNINRIEMPQYDFSRSFFVERPSGIVFNRKQDELVSAAQFRQQDSIQLVPYTGLLATLANLIIISDTGMIIEKSRM